MRTPDQIHSLVDSLRRSHAEKDERQRNVRDVRSGEIDTVVPGSMPDAWPRPIVANLIDTTARDIAEVMGAMPAINCANSVMTSERAKKFSSKRTKIAHHYIGASRLEAGKLVEFCDHYSTYGEGIFAVVPDYVRKMPILVVENPIGAYPEFDLFSQLKSFTRVWREKAMDLVAKFPGLSTALIPNPAELSYGESPTDWQDRMIEVVKYQDPDVLYMFLPEHGNRIISMMPNPMGKVMYAVARRPSVDGEVRGAFDDAIWVYLAKSRMALLGLEATEKAVRAPLFVPRDVTVMEFGGDAVIRTDKPSEAQYLKPDFPAYANAQAQLSSQELMTATRSPAARNGQMDASVITGKGVQALMGGFNTVITTGQGVITQAMELAIKFMFDMDEKLWPDEKKTIRGVVQGTPFEETYIPSKDIAGNHMVDVTYGFAAGQDPARAIVAMLQLRGDKLISRDFMQRQLPMQIDVVQMQQQVDNEEFEDALKAGTQMLMQSVGQLALQGQDPTQLLTQMAMVIKGRENGKPVHEAVLDAFKPKEQPQQPEQPGPGAMEQAPPGGAPQGPPGAQAGGQDMMRLLSSLRSSGQPQMTAQTRRQVPI